MVWNAERKTNMYLDLPCLWIFNILTVFIKRQKISLGKFMWMVSYKCTSKLIMGYLHLHLHGTCWPSLLTIIARGGGIQHSDSIYCCIMIYLFLDLKTWTRCGQDFPYPKEIFLAHKKCGTLCATTLYSWAYWQLFASIPSLFYFSYWSMFMYCICIIL